MPQQVIHNGDFFAADAFGLSFANRSFRYGDGFFETIRMEQSKVFWSERHFDRMRESACLLHLQLHPLLNDQGFIDMLKQLYRQNHSTAGPARIRISIYRKDGGLYTPESNDSGFLIESVPLEHSLYPLNDNDLLTDLYTGPPRHPGTLSRIKTSSALPFVMAAIYRQEKGLGDCFIMNTDGGIAEASSSNVFLVKDNHLLTPGLDQGCISGIMRSLIIDMARSAGYEVTETKISPRTLEDADELFLTNAISGIRRVTGFRQKRYASEQTNKLSAMLNRQAEQLLRGHTT